MILWLYYPADVPDVDQPLKRLMFDSDSLILPMMAQDYFFGR